jgi:hypothetical protein
LIQVVSNAPLVNANWHSYLAKNQDFCGFESRMGHQKEVKMRKSLEDCKEKLSHRVPDARLKILYDWIKNDEISFGTFVLLLDYHQTECVG